MDAPNPIRHNPVYIIGVICFTHLCLESTPHRRPPSQEHPCTGATPAGPRNETQPGHRSTPERDPAQITLSTQPESTTTDPKNPDRRPASHSNYGAPPPTGSYGHTTDGRDDSHGRFAAHGPHEVQLIAPPNPHIERFMRSMKSECLNRMIFFGEKSLRKALREFTTHYHQERNHQGLGNNIIIPGEEVGRTNGDVQHRERLGGMLSYYYRDAA